MSMQLRMSPEEDAMLESLAADEGKSKNQMVASLVRDRFDRMKGRTYTHSVLDSLSRDHSDLLDRLAE